MTSLVGVLFWIADSILVGIFHTADPAIQKHVSHSEFASNSLADHIQPHIIAASNI